jgi:hypothetical protein
MDDSRQGQIGQDSQGICVDEETSELSGRDLGQVERESGLEHADSHTGEQFRDKPVLPVVCEGFDKYALFVRKRASAKTPAAKTFLGVDIQW